MSGNEAAPRLNVVRAGTGPAFVFQHGLGGDAAQAAEVFPPEAPFQRITVESRGHGGSEAGLPSAFTIANFAAEIIEVIEHATLAPAVVGGISMGAAIALRIAVDRPDLVRALVLARPAWVTDPAPPNMRPYAEVGALLARYAPQEARARFEGSETAARLRREAPDNLASLIGFFSRRPHEVTRELLQRIAADGPGVTIDQIRILRTPTLVIGHGRDEAHPLAYAETLARLIPGARLMRITPKAESREAYVEDFRAALSGFLKELGARRKERADAP